MHQRRSINKFDPLHIPVHTVFLIKSGMALVRLFSSIYLTWNSYKKSRFFPRNFFYILFYFSTDVLSFLSKFIQNYIKISTILAEFAIISILTWNSGILNIQNMETGKTKQAYVVVSEMPNLILRWKAEGWSSATEEQISRTAY